MAIPAVVQDVVDHIPGEHVLVDISLQHKQHIAQTTS